MKQTTSLPGSIASESTASLNTTRLLIGLMVPMGMTILNLSMLGVALPAIRDAFAVPPDQMAWLVTAYTLPFMMFMPFYGRLSDGLGKRRLFMIGIVVFLVGTLICITAVDLRMLMVGRVVQGMGTAGVNPLCMAIIAELFPPEQQGRAMGTWSSTGPATSMIGPFLAGFLIDHWGWRSIFVPSIFSAFIAFYVVYIQLPVMRAPLRKGFLRAFDWVGMALLGTAITFLMFYLSSRAITGREPLQDWRLLAATLVAFVALVAWERRHASPLVSFAIFRRPNFASGSVTASLRMFMMSGVGFIVPLFFADVYNLNAAALGGLLTLHAGALLTTVRMGGRLADRWGSRRMIMVGLFSQASMLILLAFLPAGTPIWVAGAVLAGAGFFAGLSLAVIHRAALSHVRTEESGAAAGLYSMVRFGGNIVGATLSGVILQQALLSMGVQVAYRQAFLFIAAFGVAGVLMALRIRGTAAEAH